MILACAGGAAGAKKAADASKSSLKSKLASITAQRDVARRELADAEKAYRTLEGKAAADSAELADATANLELLQAMVARAGSLRDEAVARESDKQAAVAKAEAALARLRGDPAALAACSLTEFIHILAKNKHNRA